MIDQLPNDVISQIHKSPNRGVTCIFIKVDDDWGIKCYRQEWTRDNCFQSQEAWAKEGFAPPVGVKFQVGDYYCYSTRVAELLHENLMNESAEFWDNLEEEYYDQITNRSNEMAAAGYYVTDSHVGNWGIYEDELVFIDFDGIHI